MTVYLIIYAPLLAEIRNHLIDDFSVGLALELAHNSLHDGAFVLGGDDVSEFLLDDFFTSSGESCFGAYWLITS